MYSGLCLYLCGKQKNSDYSLKVTHDFLNIWESVFEQWKEPVCAVDKNFNFLYANKSILEILKTKKEKVKGVACKDFLFDELSAKQLEQIESVRQKREVLYIIFKNTHYELTIQPVTGSDGKLYALLFIYRNVSELINLNKFFEQSGNQTLLKTLVANFPGIIYHCKNDKYRTMEFMSDGCKHLTGYKKDDLLYNKVISFNDLIVPEDRDKVWNDYQTVLKNHSVYKGEYRIITASGDIKWVHEQGCGVYDEDSQVVAIEGFISDITEQKENELLLIEKEERFRTLFNNSAIPIWEEDFSRVKAYFNHLEMQGVENFRQYFTDFPDEVKKCVSLIEVLDINDESIRFFKMMKKEQVDFNLQNYFLEDSYETLREEIIALAEGETWFESEIPVTNFEGVKNHLLLRLVVVPGKEDSLSQILVSFIDITERKNAMFNLQESENRLRLLMNNISDCIYIKDGDGRWCDANNQGLKVFNLEGVDFYLKKDSELAKYSSFFSDALKACEETDEQAWKNKKASKFVEEMLMPSGEAKKFETLKIPIFNENGNRKYLIVIAREHKL